MRGRGRLLEQGMRFEQIESRIRAIPGASRQRHGKAFEPLVKWWLQNDPAWSSLLEEVWLWREWPDKWKEQEAGIDHVARGAGQILWAVQAKMHRPGNKVTKQAIQSFISESEGFDRRLLVTTSWELSYHARDLCERLGVVVVARADLLESAVEWPMTWPGAIWSVRPRQPRKRRLVPEERQDTVEGSRPLPLLGARLRSIRRKRGLTQLGVAAKACVSVPTLRILESGRGNLSSWQKVLSALSLTVDGSNLPQGETIGQRVAQLRRTRHVSQRKLALLAQSTPPTIVALERRSQGRLDLLERVLIALGAGHYIAEEDDFSLLSIALSAG